MATPRQVRWEFGFTVKSMPGNTNVVAAALSASLSGRLLRAPLYLINAMMAPRCCWSGMTSYSPATSC